MFGSELAGRRSWSLSLCVPSERREKRARERHTLFRIVYSLCIPVTLNSQCACLYSYAVLGEKEASGEMKKKRSLSTILNTWFCVSCFQNTIFLRFAATIVYLFLFFNFWIKKSGSSAPDYSPRSVSFLTRSPLTLNRRRVRCLDRAIRSAICFK